MKFRLSLIISVFLLVVTPIVITGLVTVQASERVLQAEAARQGITVQITEINQVRENIIYLLIIGTVVSLAGAGIFTSELANSVNIIKRGLDALSRDVNVSIPPSRGVMGEIAQSINQMAESLRETTNHRDALLASSPNGIITIDQQGKVILFNPAASNLSGIDKQAALGNDYRAVDLALPLVELLGAALRGEVSVLAKEETLFRADGTHLSAAISTSMLRNDNNDVVGALALIIDLREKRLLEAQVLRANRLAGIGELAAGVAHEIRNPLTAVKGYAQVLDEELPPDDERHEYTSVIVNEVNRLERIVRGLLAFARPSQSQFQMEKLQDMIEETLVLVDSGEFRHRIKLIKDFEPNINVQVDREQFKQILLNLLLNAGQAIREQGTIKLVTRQQQGFVTIKVCD